MEQMIWLYYIHPTQKIYFNEFVANALRENMGMIIFDLWLLDAANIVIS